MSSDDEDYVVTGADSVISLYRWRKLLFKSVDVDYDPLAGHKP